MPAPSPQPSALTGFTTDEVVLFDGEGEPRVLDLALAARLGFSRPRKARELIVRHLSSLAVFGRVRTTRGEPTASGGRPADAYWLTEKQALFIIAKSQTPKAAEITVALVEAYIAYRDGLRDAASRTSLPPGPAKSSSPDRDRNRIRFAKLRLVEAVTVLDELGVDVMAIDMATVLRFSRAVMR